MRSTRPNLHAKSARPRFAALLVASALVACGGAPSAPTTPAELGRALAAAERIEVHLPEVSTAADDEGSSTLRRRVESAARSLSERSGVVVQVLASAEAGDSGVPRVVLGTADGALPRALLESAGADVSQPGRLAWNGGVLQAPGDVLLACFEDPQREGLPLTLLVAHEQEDLLGLCDDLMPCSRPALRFASRAATVLDVPLDSAGRARPGERRAVDRGDWIQVRSSRHYRLRRAIDVEAELAESYADAVDDALASLDGWGGEGPRGFQELFLVATGAAQRAQAGGTGQRVPAGVAARSFVLSAPGLAHDHGAGAARQSLRHALGDPARAWMLDGVGVDAAGAWWGAELRGWGRRLIELELLPEVERLVHASSVDRLSQHVLAPARGLLWRHLRETRTPEQLRALWRGEVELEVSNADFAAWLRTHSGGLESLTPEARAAHRAAIEELGFWRGVSYASSGALGGGFDGAYLSNSLSSARRQAVNAVSVASLFTERSVSRLHPGGELPLGRECLEGDVALAQLFAAARAQGVGVLALRPQLLLSDSAGYSKWLRRTSVAQWQEFFDAHREMLTHYALLAELCGVDLLCLGGDLAAPQSSAGLLPEVLEARRAALTRNLDHARACFGGALTYVASWQAEVKRFEHWKQLDYVGVAWFPQGPARPAEPRGANALRHAWRSQLEILADVSERAGLPWLVLEFGVRATDGGTGETLLGPGRANPGQQARGVVALAGAIEGLAAEGRAPAGLFWWNWNASSREEEADSRGYSLQGRPGFGALHRIGDGL